VDKNYFTLAGRRQSGAESPEASGLLRGILGIAAATGFEVTLVTPLALIARTT